MKENKLQSATALLKTLSEPTRLQILQTLSREDICVCKLAERLDITHNLISFHFKKLFAAGLLTRSRDGNQIFYRIKPESRVQVEQLLKLLNI